MPGGGRCAGGGAGEGAGVKAAHPLGKPFLGMVKGWNAAWLYRAAPLAFAKEVGFGAFGVKKGLAS